MEGRRLQLSTLDDRGACNQQYDQFRERFQGEVLVTVELAVSQALDWDWNWAAQLLLSYSGWGEYSRRIESAAEKYGTAIEPLRQANRERRDTASAAWSKSMGSTTYSDRRAEDWNAAQRAWQEAFDAFEYDQELEDSLQLEFAQAKARAFAEIYVERGDK